MLMGLSEGKIDDVRQRPRNGGRAAAGLSAAILLLAVVVAAAAHGPPNTYRYAQLWQVGASVGALESGDWLLPRNQAGQLPRKPPLYTWLLAGTLKITGAYNDFVFRLPTILAAAAMVVMVFLLGRRWYGPPAGMLAACTWATCMHMSKMAYIATTDMLLCALMTGAIFCGDRLLFHRAPAGHRGRWAAAFWIFMLLGALAKGWGMANYPIIAAALGLAAVLAPGFGALGVVDGLAAKATVVFRVIMRRIRRAARDLRLGWGLLATFIVLTPLWAAMLIHGGEEFRHIVWFEYFQRLTGAGTSPPKAASAPAVTYLLYYLLPVSVYAIGAMLLVHPLRWLGRGSPLCLPLCWIVAVVVPFSISHGFRPDYLLPCYAAAALMGAWAMKELIRRGAADKTASTVRHVFAGAVIFVGSVGLLGAAGFFAQSYLPAGVSEIFRPVGEAGNLTLWLTAAVGAVGAGVIIYAVRASLRWKIRRLILAGCVGMLGVVFLDTHFINTAARSGDGDKMLRFARTAERKIGGDEFAVYKAEKLCTELYMGRFGRRLTGAGEDVVAEIKNSNATWLVTCDTGLVEMGLAGRSKNGGYTLEEDDVKTTCRTTPEKLGRVAYVSESVESQDWGRIYLINTNRPTGPETD